MSNGRSFVRLLCPSLACSRATNSNDLAFGLTWWIWWFLGEERRLDIICSSIFYFFQQHCRVNDFAGLKECWTLWCGCKERFELWRREQLPNIRMLKKQTCIVEGASSERFAVWGVGDPKNLSSGEDLRLTDFVRQEIHHGIVGAYTGHSICVGIATDIQTCIETAETFDWTKSPQNPWFCLQVFHLALIALVVFVAEVFILGSFGSWYVRRNEQEMNP